MTAITRCAAVLGWLLAAVPMAHAQSLTRQTSCTDLIAINRAGPNGPDMQAQAVRLLAIINPYLPQDGRPPQTQPLLRPLMALMGLWCSQHPQDSVGHAVDQAALLEHLTARADTKPPEVVLIAPRPPPAAALPDAATIARLNIFRQTCLTLQTPAMLRAWAALHHGIALPAQGLAIGRGGGPGKMFDMAAVMPDTILISMDNGTCMILTRNGELARYESAMEHASWGPGTTFVVTQDMRDPLNESVVREYDLSTRDWGQVVSVGGPTTPTGAPIMMISAPRRQAT